MPRIEPILCPQCGGGLKVKRTDEIVQCPYCQVSAFVRRPGMTVPPALPPGQPPPIYYVDAPKQPSRRLAIIVSLVVPIAVLSALGFAIEDLITRQFSQSREATDDGGLAMGDSEASNVGPGAAGPRQPKFVDAAEIIENALRKARQEVADARFIDAHFASVREGKVDVNAKNVAHVGFEYRIVDSSKPAGSDVEEGSFHIRVDQGEYAVWARVPHGNVSSALGLPPQASATPKCRSVDAWKKVVESGVPADAIASLLFDRGDSRSQGRSYIEWSFRVEGHPEHRREIDATTCALRRSWAKTGGASNRVMPPPSQGAKAKPSPPRTKGDSLQL